MYNIVTFVLCVDDWVKVTRIPSGGYHQRDLCSNQIHALHFDIFKGDSGLLPPLGVGEEGCVPSVRSSRRHRSPPPDSPCFEVCLRIPPLPVSTSVAVRCFEAAEAYYSVVRGPAGAVEPLLGVAGGGGGVEQPGAGGER